MSCKVLITGITGLVGRAIAGRLASASYQIIGIGRKESANVNFPVEYFRTDISNVFALSCVIGDSRPDIIVHCAAAISNDNLALEIIDANVRGTKNLINIAIEHGVKKFIYISSLPIIGLPQECPITEEHAVYPQTAYHLTKYFGELLLETSSKVMNYAILRLPSPVGVGMPKNKILTVFIVKCLKNENLILLGKGGRMQNYIDVRDVAAAVECSIQSNSHGVYNIAAEQSYSNLELAEMCKSVLQSKSEILFDGVDVDEEVKWVYSTQKAKEYLHFTAKIPLERTINDIAHSLQAYL